MLTIANPGDLDEMCALIKVMHDENGVGRLDQSKVRGAISEVIASGGCLVAKQDGRIVGSVGLIMDEWWYSSEKALIDRWFFVHPDHRKFGHATRLIAAMKAAADTSGLPVVLQVSSTVDTLSKLKFFKRHLTPLGGAFIHMPRAA
jgi:GNAT superfamily N-acetyltransferase